MATNGEDSLNDTGDAGFVDPGMEDLRNRLHKPLPAGGIRDTEPSREQLIATGELDPDEGEGDNESEGEGSEREGGTGNSSAESKGNGNGGEGKLKGRESSVALEPTEKEKIGIRRQVKARLLEGATREELLQEGYNRSTISTVASELKKELGGHRSIGTAPMVSKTGVPIFAKGAPPEALIESLEMPDISDGQGVAFEQGTKFGMSIVILGVRVAQELSGIGVTQAKPLLDMAKSMREGEAMAAKNAAGEAAMEAAGMVQQSIMPILSNIQSKEAGGGGADPMKSMMVRTMEPMLQKVMAGLMGGLMPGAAPQLPPATAPRQLGPGETATSVDGWKRRTEE